MKKLNQSGFILAETLVVTVFLMTLFTTIYVHYFPLIGEYEKRENYDSVDGKYSAYWIKRMIESNVYTEKFNAKKALIERDGYVRFHCGDLNADRKNMCIDLMMALQVNGCDDLMQRCDIYITTYKIDSIEGTAWFKQVVKNNLESYQENCTDSTCFNNFVSACQTNLKGDTSVNCEKVAHDNVFSSGFQDYLASLPAFTRRSLNNANYRVFVVFHNTQDANNYYSYATLEINR